MSTRTDQGTRAPTVANCALLCNESFEICLRKAETIHPRELSLVENQLFRFTAWRDSIRVFARGRASLDYRLHEAPGVKDAVTAVLETLDVSVRACSEILDTLSLEAYDQELSEVNEKFDEGLRNVAENINSLHKLSNTIRKASRETQNDKAEKVLVIRDDEGNDAETFLQSIFENYMLGRFPGSSKTLQQRLASTMLIRRKRILYRRQRYGKTPIRAPDIPSQTPILHYQARPALNSPEKAFDGPQQGPAVLNAPPSIAQSATQSATQTATTLSPEVFRRIASSPSMVSSSKTVALNRHEDLVFPAPPCGSLPMRYRKQKREQEKLYNDMLGSPQESLQIVSLNYNWSEYLRAVGELTCPFCLMAIPVEDMVDEKKWKLHVKNDLDPYVCLFEDCDSPEKIYSHFDEWLRHMQEHALRWRCSSKSHGVLIFNTRDEYLKHMIEDHVEKFTNSQLETLARRNARKAGHIFTSCPLCQEFNDTDGDVARHVVGHMRSLALKSLPSYEEDIEGLSDLDGDDETSAANQLTRSTLYQLSSSNGIIDPTDAEIADVDARRHHAAFHDYLRINSKKGIDIDQDASEYVTDDILREYWTPEEVSEILETSQIKPIASILDTVMNGYIRVWSTLVRIGSPEYINLFRNNEHDDEYFYAFGFSADAYLRDDQSMQQMLAEFGKHWVKFWPVRFLSARAMHPKLDSKRILPVTSSRQIVSSTSQTETVTREVILDPSCCDYSNKKVIFKVYTDASSDEYRAFSREVETFKVLGQDGKDVIVDYLGSFSQKGKGVIILEHANGGNLRNFFETRRRPRNNAEQIYLWSKLFKLSDAVYHLQHSRKLTSPMVHRNIKFENILYFMRGHPDAFDFDFKLTDFDARTVLGFSRQENDISRTRGAPETTESKSEQVFVNSDMWQLGTVFSEALICTLWGINALPGYEERRRRETKSSPNLVNSGSEICFHDGQNRLPCIAVIHQEALLSRAVFDSISQQVAELIVDEMLVPHKRRAQPEQLTAKFEKLLADIGIDSPATGTLPQRSGQEHIRIHTDPTTDGNLSRVHPMEFKQEDLSLPNTKASEVDDDRNILDPNSNPQDGLSPAQTDELAQGATDITNGLPQMINQRSYAESSTKANHQTLHTKDSSRTEPPWVTAEDVELWRMTKKKGTFIPIGMNQIIEELNDRDQLFVIDDSMSMKVHLPNIVRVAKAMISLAKKADPNGVELIFTSKPGQIQKKRRFSVKSETNDLVNRISSRFEDELPMSTNMEHQLGTILDRFTSWSRAKTSVYIYTDGVWKDSIEPGGGVESPIKTLIAKLKERGQNRTDVTIQFIRFGDDEIGSKRLAWLDDELPKSKAGLQDFDIVDTRRHDDNLFLLMIGAIRRSVDEIK